MNGEIHKLCRLPDCPERIHIPLPSPTYPPFPSRSSPRPIYPEDPTSNKATAAAHFATSRPPSTTNPLPNPHGPRHQNVHQRPKLPCPESVHHRPLQSPQHLLDRLRRRARNGNTDYRPRRLRACILLRVGAGDFGAEAAAEGGEGSCDEEVGGRKR